MSLAGVMIPAASWLPGLISSATVAAAAGFLTHYYGGPALLFALLLGMALNFLSQVPTCQPGLQIASSRLLRASIALLGVQVTLDEVAQLGWHALAHVAVAVPATILLGVVLARWLGLGTRFGIQAGGAVAICGVSASMAIAAVLPWHKHKERDSIFIAVGVSSLSALAMVIYPLIAHALGLDLRAAGEFLGGTIHDVAQAVGAGFSVSAETGQVATLVKLSRVAMLVPVVLVIMVLMRWRRPSDTVSAMPAMPWFLVVFAVLVAMRSSVDIGASFLHAAQLVSTACMSMAVAAIGMRTRPQEMLQMGARPIALLLLVSAFLAAAYGLVLRFGAAA